MDDAASRRKGIESGLERCVVRRVDCRAGAGKFWPSWRRLTRGPVPGEECDRDERENCELKTRHERLLRRTWLARGPTHLSVALVGLLEPTFDLQVEIAQRGEGDAVRNAVLLSQTSGIVQARSEWFFAEGKT